MDKLERSKQHKPQDDQMSHLSRSLLTGLVGGMLWSTVGFVFFYFNFVEVAPRAFVIRSFITADWTSTWLGHLLSIVLTGIISMLPAFIYHIFFKKIYTLWAGVLFGVGLWAIVFYVLNPVFPNIARLAEFDRDTIVSTLFLYILYGAFVGYSISYDYEDANQQKKQKQSPGH